VAQVRRADRARSATGRRDARADWLSIRRAGWRRVTAITACSQEAQARALRRARSI